MVAKVTPRILRIPTFEEMQTIFEAYAAAVGKVAFSWNFLLERLGFLFVAVSGIDQPIGLAVWYSSENDRNQILMLKAAAGASKDDRWLPRFPAAKSDLGWLSDRVIGLHDARNNALHAPCQLYTDADHTVMAASYFSGHRRARKLFGKDLLVEFHWCEQWADRLSLFASAATLALTSDDVPWPQKPEKPDR